VIIASVSDSRIAALRHERRVRHLLSLIKQELWVAMALTGSRSTDTIGPDLLVRQDNRQD